jgi:hypothetical protein
LQKNQTLAEKHLQDIKDIIQLLIDRMITRIERDVDGKNEQPKKKFASINILI